MKKIKVAFVDIHSDLQNLLTISKEITNTFYNKNMVEAMVFTEEELLNGDVDSIYCPNWRIIRNYKKAIEKGKYFFRVRYKPPFYETEGSNGKKIEMRNIINILFFIIDD